MTKSQNPSSKFQGSSKAQTSKLGKDFQNLVAAEVTRIISQANQSLLTSAATVLKVALGRTYSTWSLVLGPWCFFGTWFLVLGTSLLLSDGDIGTVPDKPHVLIRTTLGDIEVELDRVRAPFTVTNFVSYIQQGLYSNGVFHRTVTLANQPTNTVKIQVIQASADAMRTNEYLPPIRIERTRDTGLKHLEGVISMARAEPDSAQHDFFICIGDQPELDFGGKRNPDGQGFAAFGKVVKGMDVVRRIHASPAEGQNLAPMIKIQRALRLN